MCKFFRKFLDGAITIWLILAMLILTPPLYTVIAALPEQEAPVDLSSADSTGEILALELAGDVPGFIPKAEQRMAFSCFNRILASARLILDCAMRFDEIKVFAEIEVYLLNNDLHYNTPSVTFRQPASEHTSEG